MPMPNKEHNRSVRDSHRLLASYPISSAVPSGHVARHLDNLSITAAPPSFANQQYYNPPPYGTTGFANRTNTGNETRDQAVALLSQQAGISYPYPPAQQWTTPHTNSVSSYQTPNLAQAIFSNGYPTPPVVPPRSSSYTSSFSWGVRPDTIPPNQLYTQLQQQHILPPRQHHAPADSLSFFKQCCHPEVSANAAEQTRTVDSRKKEKNEVFVEVSPSKRANLGHGQSTSNIPSTPSRLGQSSVKSSSAPSIFPKTPSTTHSSASSVPLTPPPLSSTPQSRRSISTVSGTSFTRKTLTLDRIESVPALQKPFITPLLQEYPSPDDSETELEDDEDELNLTSSPLKLSSGRDQPLSHDRDDRAPIDKLVLLIQEIFDVEDGLPSDPSPVDLSRDGIFNPESDDSSKPQLCAVTIRKLTKYIGQVRGGRGLGKSVHTSPVKGRAGRGGRIGDIDSDILSRLLRLLARSIRLAYPLLALIKLHGRRRVGRPWTKTKEIQDKTRKRTRSRSKMGFFAAESIIALLGGESVKVTKGEMLSKQLYSEEIILGCFNVVKSALEGEVYPFVEACSGIGSGLLMYIVTAPGSKAPTSIDPSTSSPPSISAKTEACKHLLGEIFTAVSAILPRISALVGGANAGGDSVMPMSDAVVIKAVYVGIGPFFISSDEGSQMVHDDWDGEEKGKSKAKGKVKKRQGGGLLATTFGKSAMRGLRMDALGLIRSIFAHHDDQRTWIIEEILSSLIKVSHAKSGKSTDQFRLRDGRSMRTVSALLLQLVQTSAHDVRLEARKIDRARQAKVALRRQESIIVESQQSQTNIGHNEKFLDEEDRATIRLHNSALASPLKAATFIVHFLTSRSGKTKTTKDSNEAEYRAIFDALVQDCLTVWCWPEWPSAGVVLNVVVKCMTDNLKEKKGEKEATGDNNAGKSMALEHLGVIAAKVRSLALKVEGKDDKINTSVPLSSSGSTGSSKAKSKSLKSLTQIVDDLDLKELDRYLSAHWDVVAHLGKRAAEDQAYDSAQELSTAALGHDLAGALQRLAQWIEEETDDRLRGKVTDTNDDGDAVDLQRKVGGTGPGLTNSRRSRARLQPFGEKLKIALREVWKERGADLFDLGSPEEVVRVDRQAEEIGIVQGSSLKKWFHAHALDAPVIFMRTKALRALGQIITSDPSILVMPEVRKGIESHLLDSSPAVRDAAVELIGKYMIDSPDVAADYYSKIADRIADTGLGVRKRVIKLLKTFYVVTDSVQRQTDIATKLVLRMMDEDDTVKDLAIKAVEELWFPSAQPSMPPSALKHSKLTTGDTKEDSNDLLQNKVAVIMAVSANFRDRQSPLEDLLHKVMHTKEEGSGEARAMHLRYKEICDVLIDGLVDASDLPGFTVVNCIRTINLIASAYPMVIGSQNALTLLPYLKNPSNAEEQMTSDYLLKTFRAAIPHMPKTAAKFGQDLQVKLQPMVTKPSATGGIATLQEVVACLCTVVQYLTHEFTRLVALLKSCNARLQQAIGKPEDSILAANEFKTLSTLIFIVSLLAENCDFDKLRVEQPTTATDLDAISSTSITEHVYTSLIHLHQRYRDATFRARVLPCLGFLFRAQPTLMILDKSAAIMDEIFASEDSDGKARLLKIIQDFLISESIKHSQKEKESAQSRTKPTQVNMDELVGNTDGFADSGVSSAVVQRYLDPILDAAFSQHAHIQASALDILSFTVKQGLAHPLQSFPIIVALETSSNASLSNRASALHAILHNKHTSLLNSRFTMSAWKSFEYQRKITPDTVHGYRMQPTPVAVLQRWYSLVRDKRAQRQDFLKALVKVFQDRPDYKSSQDDIHFTRYMAENFSAFEYKTQEEVFTVIKFLTTVLSTAGLHILEILSPAHLLSELHATDQGEQVVIENDVTDELPLIRTSVIIGMVMLLKAHLKTLYALSEERCNKFSLIKKSTIGDKAAVKRHEKPISWNRLPFVMKPILTSVDVKEQKDRFKEIWFEDGVAAEPEDEFT
ncbi:hypothetical protein BDP27DRAFT_1341215 [Rhodocollybia butyracea]|uniref:Sister chromatid cohesion protein n=1 Tax=Rhodocollybia butyracea TaxID=206335 RepID=A0A9P5TZK5_9AGAR|nr:hypothetical protein BDP27DRAFT_1341215 [Rhodocollybia butyracea]